MRRKCGKPSKVLGFAGFSSSHLIARHDRRGIDRSPMRSSPVLESAIYLSTATVWSGGGGARRV